MLDAKYFQSSLKLEAIHKKNHLIGKSADTKIDQSYESDTELILLTLTLNQDNMYSGT